MLKEAQEWALTDITIPADQHIINPKEEKVYRHQDLIFKIISIHRVSKVTMIPIVTGALGSISKNAKAWEIRKKNLEKTTY